MEVTRGIDGSKKIHLFLSQFLLTWINLSDSQVLYEEISIPSLHPRTFYLSPNQEFQVISQVLCEGLPCPEYTITHDYPYFIQQRNYRAFTFMKLTSPLSCQIKLTLNEGKKRMSNYIKGANNREQIYSSTLPLLIEVEHTGSKSTNPWCRMSYSANFYTPHFWGIVATPNEIVPEFGDFPDNLRVYVRTFNGKVEDVLLREIELFRRNLDNIGLCYKKTKFYVAIYNIPHNPYDSRNELWFIRCTK
ncbi:uncharacterized protein CDAR_263701 [Caerostris darwini]|uniref:Heme-binding protein 2 n=1 Tax=Caerostris darwini TaxID=1538125 RepID=A0AAV4RX75_9ARAC|nr:uncharacterized protein CDAR_263701 [Caerostris darwini]